jgi:hypothetical protein
MIALRKFALLIVVTVPVSWGIAPLRAQTESSRSQSSTLAVSVALEKEKVPAGEAPRAVLTIKNLSDHSVSMRTDMLNYRVRVEGQAGEMPTTLYHRQVSGRMLPGERPLAGGGVVLGIAPGDSDTRSFDLTRYYDLKVPGRYSVRIDVLDEASGEWLRTNTAQFEVEASAQ